MQRERRLIGNLFLALKKRTQVFGYARQLFSGLYWSPRNDIAFDSPAFSAVANADLPRKASSVIHQKYFMRCITTAILVLFACNSIIAIALIAKLPKDSRNCGIA